jgi:hypothetical protein
MHPKQLPIPPIAQTDINARELLRVWAAGGKQHLTLATNLWKDPAAWGVMLVDLAKHIAAAYQQTSGEHQDSVLSRIREGFDAEWNHSTDEPIGGIEN